MAMTSSKYIYRHQYQPLPAGVFVTPFPYAHFYGWDEETTIEFCLKQIDYLLHGQSKPEETAAFIIEPILGEGGYVPAPAGFMQELRVVCKENDILLIVDEVQSGFGRTGKFFAYEHYDTPPDLMAMGKGIAGGYFPLGGVAVAERVVDAIAQGSGIFAAGHTWAGNPLGAAVANKTMDILEEQNLVARCAEMGQYLGEKLEGLTSHPIVGDVRGEGLMRGLEFVKDKETREPLDPALMFWIDLHHQAQSKGLVIESSGGCERGQSGDMAMLGPSFIVTRYEIDEIVGLLDDTLTDMEKKIGV